MARKKDAATEFAERMLHVLEARRGLGPDAYPLRLRDLAALTDRAAPAALVLQAAGKKKPFQERALVVKPKDLDSPLALREDADLLAASPLLLVYVLEATATPARPTWEAAALRTKVPAVLRPAFLAATRDRVATQTLPPGVGLVTVRNQVHLHLLRYPLPRPAEALLAEELLQTLRAQRERSGSYPLSLAHLVERTRPGVAAALLRKALNQPAFRDATLVALKGKPESPVALSEDRDLLASSPLLLETTLRLARSAATHAIAPGDLAKKVIPALKKPLVEAVTRRVLDRALPAGLGALLLKGKPLLFRLEDVVTARPIPAPAPVPAPPELDFAAAFDEAFQRLDQEQGRHNFVSLVDLRRALPMERAAFDAGLRELRRTGRYTLSAAEGRHGLRPEEIDAGVSEDGVLLLFVARRLA